MTGGTVPGGQDREWDAEGTKAGQLPESPARLESQECREDRSFWGKEA